MSTSIVLTVVSKDHPGIVETLSELLADHGGNWTESSMLSMAGQFAGILLASVPDRQVEAFVEGLAGLESKGMQIVAKRAVAARGPAAEREFTLDLVGQDRPGIVHDITMLPLRTSRTNSRTWPMN